MPEPRGGWRARPQRSRPRDPEGTLGTHGRCPRLRRVWTRVRVLLARVATRRMTEVAKLGQHTRGSFPPLRGPPSRGSTGRRSQRLRLSVTVLAGNAFPVDQTVWALAGTRPNVLSSVAVSESGRYAALRDGSSTRRRQVRMVRGTGFEPPAPPPRVGLTDRPLVSPAGGKLRLARHLPGRRGWAATGGLPRVHSSSGSAARIRRRSVETL